MTNVEKFERLVALTALSKFVKNQFMMSKSFNIVCLLSVLAFWTIYYIMGDSSPSLLGIALIVLMLPITMGAVMWIDVIVDNGFYYRTFEEFKRKMANQTNMTEESIEPFLDKEGFQKSSIVHCLECNNKQFFLKQKQMLENELLGDCDGNTQQAIEQIAEHLKDFDRDQNPVRFDCLKKLVKTFNESIEGKSFDSETVKELQKAGVNFPQTKRQETLKINESEL